ncbi:PH domain containing protein [Trichomonas vaginalis G3]|uniref:PH domain containing protein n=1 Tax=Trichomonas vaginalis (strain ATCC PRA-98 / G3) TaxID=412133 RepID=A2ERM3_TRIV3|nr:spectrin binding [Trichomonas vaginalis G3]EAY04675.1 PH domain containing protein [Trichomonas vaginalis G3]KAI5530916.1 spectrin binding [Trichomonas vaginalis G3]|eukprot:XP_001316898.1 PH domain containing protein [Trichomonas vaginalis G3]
MSVIKEGVIKKQGHFIKNIKERWLVLTTETLCYYTGKKGQLKGEIKLTKDMKLYNNKEFKLQPCFSLEDGTRRTYNFVPESKTERDAWISAIEFTISLLNGPQNAKIIKRVGDIIDKFYNISELLWGHHSDQISQVVKLLQRSIEQNDSTFEDALTMIARIQKHRVASTAFYAEVVDTLAKKLGEKLKDKHLDILHRFKYVLIKLNIVHGTLPEEYKDYTDKELIFK